ncbi:MAG: hypothetical protein RJQ00_06680 [Vicingaceae bacterium]
MLLALLKKYQLQIIAVLYLVISFFILLLFNGTGGEADSIHHYLYAKFAPEHPELFLNHWAKPIFTLFASPFAQFGFIGVKVFNVLMGLISVIYTFKIARQFKLNNAPLASLFYFIFPLTFTINYSGFTEPIFAAMLCISIHFCLKNKFLLAAILVSFMPFARSEGLLFIGLFALYFILRKKYKCIFYLLIGHLLFSAIGFIFGDTPLWVATKIPYASLQSHYGSGELTHFAEKLIHITGVPLLFLFLLGLINSIVFKKWSNVSHQTTFKLLIFGGFLLFFIAHSLFWYLGIFNSMGLKRVFGAITPLMAILALLGFNTIEKIQLNWFNKTLKLVSLAYILIFPFTSNPAALDWKVDMNLSKAQLTAEATADFILSLDSLKNRRFIYTDPYLGKALNIDPFDVEQRLILSPKVFSELRRGDVVIWDNWHSVIDYGLEINALKKQEAIHQIKEFKNQNVTYIVFIAE